ncbi:hypothetical protein C2G38_2183387 [Gigaspora rosea]|uniref:Uncharacterized protein n=1 Tax=Gigaspora rosea TaxID=44941 RepID=A0A397VHV6_9GLOM|nr:hypothetical protein C2G38_2183387 [Gigaspora rosea]
MIYDYVELAGTNLMEGEGCQEPIKISIFVNGLEVRDNILEENGINHKISIVNEIHPIMRFFKVSNEQATYLRGDHLYSNSLGLKNNHEIITNLENKGLDNEAYRKIDCALLVLGSNICANCRTLQNTLYQIEIQHKMTFNLLRHHMLPKKS